MVRAKVRYKSNAPVVIRAGHDAAEDIGKRMGAYIMTTARRLLRRKLKSGEPSAPGTTPRVGNAFKRNVRFEYDKAARSTVIGPQKLGGVATPDALEALEEGLDTTREVGPKKRRRRVRAHYAPRPFMLPAFRERIDELPGLWKNAIHE